MEDDDRPHAPPLQYPLRDIDPSWARDIPMESRADKPKWNAYMDGEYATTLSDPPREGPWVKIRLGSVFIDREPVHTHQPAVWRLEWTIPTTGVSGSIDFGGDADRWTGSWDSGHWQGTRARRVGTRHGVSLYCPLRRIPEDPQRAWALPFPPLNPPQGPARRNWWTTPAASPSPDNNATLTSWNDLVGPVNAERIRTWLMKHRRRDKMALLMSRFEEGAIQEVDLSALNKTYPCLVTLLLLLLLGFVVLILVRLLVLVTLLLLLLLGLGLAPAYQVRLAPVRRGWLL